MREANEKIRFSIHFDARKNQQMQDQGSVNKFLNVKQDLYNVKKDIQGLKQDLKTAEKPLLVSSIKIICTFCNHFQL